MIPVPTSPMADDLGAALSGTVKLRVLSVVGSYYNDEICC